ncbi:MAG: tetratricopeptide repeat protein [Planctomycetota bacterium]|nr:tetratricopeptide repeat protein [Planctomycetota bacterium]
MAAADNFFSKADMALKKRNYDYAIELYQQGLQIDPDRFEERKRLRQAQIRKIQDKGGSTQGGAGVKLKNGFLLASIRKLGMQKKYEEQIIEIEKFLCVAPQSATELFLLAEAFLATDRKSSAKQAYTEVTDSDSGNVEAWKALGRIYEEDKELDDAIECWERVRQIAPQDGEAGKAIRNLSAAQMMAQTEKRKQEGDGSFRDLLKSEDESKKLEQAASIIRSADDARSAVDIAREKAEAEPENSRLWRDLGDIQAKARDYDGARASYEKAQEVNPQDLYAADKLGGLEESILVDRIEALRKKVEGGDGAAEAELQQVQAQQKEFMLTETERRVNDHPTDFGLKFKFGELLTEAGRWDEAIAQFQNARKDPKFVTGSTYQIGKSFFHKQLFDLAIKEYGAALEQITEVDSDLAKSVRYDLALAHEQKGESDKALEFLEEIMSVDISFRDVSQKVTEIRSSL